MRNALQNRVKTKNELANLHTEIEDLRDNFQVLLQSLDARVPADSKTSIIERVWKEMPNKRPPFFKYFHIDHLPTSPEAASKLQKEHLRKFKSSDCGKDFSSVLN